MSLCRPRPPLHEDLWVVAGSLLFCVLVVGLADVFLASSQHPPLQASTPVLESSGRQLRVGPGVTCFDLPDGILCTCDTNRARDVE